MQIEYWSAWIYDRREDGTDYLTRLPQPEPGLLRLNVNIQSAFPALQLRLRSLIRCTQADSNILKLKILKNQNRTDHDARRY